MSKPSLILLAAGSSTRFGLPVKKQWLYQGEIPLWLLVARQYQEAFGFEEIIVTGHPDELAYMKQFADYTFVPGGSSRQASLANALKRVSREWVLVNDIARCCLDEAMVKRVLEKKGEADCIVPALQAVDTVYYENRPVERNAVRLIQTPQLSRTPILRKALDLEETFTDESSAIHAAGGRILFVEGSSRARKLTHPGDLHQLDCLIPPASRTLTGYGLDIHAFEAGKPMVLGGVPIDSPVGFKAHSDGDVAVHALIDALLGAAGMGDIGEHFPDTDPCWKGADSMELLEEVLSRIRSCGLVPLQADLTILAQVPKLGPYKTQIRQQLARTMGLLPARVNVKATTAEKMGFVGREEGVAVHAVATLGIYDWSKKS
ncbi:bifunctional 2-C-methyl-D-erythritol 4-phosphate cytidylyltransferase/2-C-methyl-D-erythritol 2,4-cyclodiphosphate synthase [Nitratifractor sp.]|uniref:bifunctional 2-C-methyl-D-erythritol 4-phosphate cytidylyltransferase/2-C-methyl-D-erythritol 2,4-cyclodiphosphate synthase n=1 Tax=Nitratifractor sp. TaxID=2268144 RepID=UPI0025FA2B2A|nr:bifunctional 2-C-methyl-D-erythritol 4-phosphate cytidylyltransferase/2-C-methyl-D-erythritol 2,4-cyclodiphosphate synthase [Nitratifractor sp.]